MPIKDLTGQRFTRLIVRSSAGVTGGAHSTSVWNCVCDCGNLLTAITPSLKSGNTKSCGCYAKERQAKSNLIHGSHAKHMYHTWQNMKQRCLNPKRDCYGNYGGRGISICKQWIDGFEAFMDWSICNGWQAGLTLDRIDVNGNYEPANCRWATRSVQQNNRRASIKYDYQGEYLTITEISQRAGIKTRTLFDRVKNKGLCIEDAINYKRYGNN